MRFSKFSEDSCSKLESVVVRHAIIENIPGVQMKSVSILLVSSVLAVAIPVSADEPEIPIHNEDACMGGPLAQFGRYIGNWDIADSQLSQDGTEWSDGEGAQWNFVCIGNGTAVQDFWMPANGAVGTNLRIYNDVTGNWDIAWAINGLPGFAYIQAREDKDGNIVMHYKTPIPNPLRRITFFPPDDAGWNWTMELSTDDGETWFPAYRIRATPSE